MWLSDRIPAGGCSVASQPPSCRSSCGSPGDHDGEVGDDPVELRGPGQRVSVQGAVIQLADGLGRGAGQFGGTGDRAPIIGGSFPGGWWSGQWGDVIPGDGLGQPHLLGRGWDRAGLQLHGVEGLPVGNAAQARRVQGGPAAGALGQDRVSSRRPRRGTSARVVPPSVCWSGSRPGRAHRTAGGPRRARAPSRPGPGLSVWPSPRRAPSSP